MSTTNAITITFIFLKAHLIHKIENGTRRAQIPRKPLIFPSPNKQTNKQTDEQTDKQKILSTQRFQLSTFAFLAQCSYRLSYSAVLIWLLLSDYYYQITIILDLIEILIQNPPSSSWETVIRISDPDFNPVHAQLWTRSSYDLYLPTHQISSKSDQ